MDDIYEVLIAKLKDSDLIEYFSTRSGLDSPDSSTLIELSKRVKYIFIYDNNIYKKVMSGDYLDSSKDTKNRITCSLFYNNFVIEDKNAYKILCSRAKKKKVKFKLP